MSHRGACSSAAGGIQWGHDTAVRRLEHAVGDKGGRKDKEKSKQQHDTKVKEAQKRKDEKNRPKTP